MNRTKLFCIPFAGSSSAVYYRWKKIIDPRIEVIPIELTGRATRMREPFYKTFHEGVIDLTNQIMEQIDDQQPYAIFGHSMGSWFTYEIARQLQMLNQPLPCHLFLSARWSPNLHKKDEMEFQAGDEEFLQQVGEFGGTPKEVLEDPRMRKIFFPILREDLRILNEYHYIESNVKLPIEFSVFSGSQDPHVDFDELQDWKTMTTEKTKFTIFDGDHFFLTSNEIEVCNTISNHLFHE